MIGSIKAKLFGGIVDSNLSEWAEKGGKRAYRQTGFHKHCSTIDHLVTLQVFMTKSSLEGKNLYC